ncbi:MAG: DUF378 domain-containing protein [Solirubrobacteraceae bacterium]|jgi:uncharacterized protein
MDYLNRLEPLFLVLVILAGLNWLIIALFDTNVVTAIFGGGTVADVVYVVFGLAALAFLPKLFDELGHMGRHDMRAHGA